MTRVGRVDPLAGIYTAAKRDLKRIVLSEGNDQRVIEAAVQADRRKIARITLLGDPSNIERQLQRMGADDADIEIVAPPKGAELRRFAEAYAAIRGNRLRKDEDPCLQVGKPLWQAATMVQMGLADGTVGGAVHTTSETIRAAIRVIGPAENDMVSSFFLMIMPDRVKLPQCVVFTDCGLVAAPDSEQLAHIALRSAGSAARLLDIIPRIAFLSFSTSGSANHPRARRVAKAARIAQSKRPDLDIIGEVQFDAAVVASIRAAKVASHPMIKQPNIFVFPDLDSGNIGYKIAERIGGATAIGPVLQGLARPANDLSRGCTAADILPLIAVTAVQASD